MTTEVRTWIFIGAPNVGKTFLFNHMTGLDAPTGNWAGVTVEASSQCWRFDSSAFCLKDLPGLYHLYDAAELSSDIALAQQAIISSDEHTGWIHVLDVRYLPAQLFLTSQLLERGAPMMVVLNDGGEGESASFDTTHAEKLLGCPVMTAAQWLMLSPEVLHERLSLIKPLRTGEGSATLCPISQQDFLEDARRRYAWAEPIAQALGGVSQNQTLEKTQSGAQPSGLDRIFFHPKWGLFSMAFVLIFSLMFILECGLWFQDGVLSWGHEGIKKLFMWAQLPAWTEAMVSGALEGSLMLLSLIPLLGLVFFSLRWAEHSGLMARAVVLGDRILSTLGLPGQSIIPILMGLGCNVPAILSTAALARPRDRTITALLLPWVQCSARLSVFVFVASLLTPQYAWQSILWIYLLSLVVVCAAASLMSTFFKGTPQPLCMPLPQWCWPSWRRLLSLTWQQMLDFLNLAVLWILPVGLLIGALASVHVGPEHHHLWRYLAEYAAPVFAPMGLNPEAWPAMVALMAGLWNKEMLLLVLTGGYAVLGLKAGASSASLLEIMQHHFSGHSAMAYLIFVALYTPCFASTVALARVLSTREAVLSYAVSCLMAYGCAVVFYQSSVYWGTDGPFAGMLVLLLALGGLFLALKSLRWQNV